MTFTNLDKQLLHIHRYYFIKTAVHPEVAVIIHYEDGKSVVTEFVPESARVTHEFNAPRAKALIRLVKQQYNLR